MGAKVSQSNICVGTLTMPGQLLRWLSWVLRCANHLRQQNHCLIHVFTVNIERTSGGLLKKIDTTVFDFFYIHCKCNCVSLYICIEWLLKLAMKQIMCMGVYIYSGISLLITSCI